MDILFMKGKHTIHVVDNGTRARIKGLHGYLNSIDLLILLTLNGYHVI